MIMDRMPRYGDKEFIDAPLPDPAPAGARTQMSHAEAYAQAQQVAGWLRSRGIGLEDHVGLVGFNSIPWAVAFIACHLVGAVPIMVNSALVMDSMIHCLKITHPKIILADAVSAVALAPYRAQLGKLGCGELVSWQGVGHLDGPKDIPVLDFASHKADPKAVEDIMAGRGGGLERLNPDCNASVFFTSGTTGYPKAVMASHRANMHNLVSAMICELIV